MTKNDILNDMTFRDKCVSYGLDWANFDLFIMDNGDEVIILHQPNSNVYVLLDKNYNTFCIEICDWLLDEDLKRKFVETRYDRYCTLKAETSNGGNFGEPFEDFTLKDFLDVNSKAEIRALNHGHSKSVYLNEKELNEEEAALLSYIKFLSLEIDDYFRYSFHMQTLGFDVPSVYTYIKAIIARFNKAVDTCLTSGHCLRIGDIEEGLGQRRVVINNTNLLYDIIDILLKARGKMVGNVFEDDFTDIEPLDIKKIGEELKKKASEEPAVGSATLLLK